MKNFLLVSFGVIIGIVGIAILLTNGIIVPRARACLNPIRYNELEHNRRWGTFVEANDTTYFDGCLFIFDTVTLEYKRVATVTIQPVK